MKYRTKKSEFIIKSLIGFAFFTLVMLLFVGFWFGTALAQRDVVSTESILFGVAHLERTRLDIVALDDQGHWLKRAYIKGVFQLNGDALDKLWAMRGWKHCRQDGSTRLYCRGARTSAVECHMYSRKYEICSETSVPED